MMKKIYTIIMAGMMLAIIFNISSIPTVSADEITVELIAKQTERDTPGYITFRVETSGGQPDEEIYNFTIYLGDGEEKIFNNEDQDTPWFFHYYRAGGIYHAYANVTYNGETYTSNIQTITINWDNNNKPDLEIVDAGIETNEYTGMHFVYFTVENTGDYPCYQNGDSLELAWLYYSIALDMPIGTLVIVGDRELIKFDSEGSLFSPGSKERGWVSLEAPLTGIDQYYLAKKISIYGYVDCYEEVNESNEDNNDWISVVDVLTQNNKNKLFQSITNKIPSSIKPNINKIKDITSITPIITSLPKSIITPKITIKPQIMPNIQNINTISNTIISDISIKPISVKPQQIQTISSESVSVSKIVIGK